MNPALAGRAIQKAVRTTAPRAAAPALTQLFSAVPSKRPEALRTSNVPPKHIGNRHVSVASVEQPASPTRSNPLNNCLTIQEITAKLKEDDPTRDLLNTFVNAIENSELSDSAPENIKLAEQLAEEDPIVAFKAKETINDFIKTCEAQQHKPVLDLLLKNESLEAAKLSPDFEELTKEQQGIFVRASEVMKKVQAAALANLQKSGTQSSDQASDQNDANFDLIYQAIQAGQTSLPEEVIDSHFEDEKFDSRFDKSELLKNLFLFLVLATMVSATYNNKTHDYIVDFIKKYTGIDIRENNWDTMEPATFIITFLASILVGMKRGNPMTTALSMLSGHSLGKRAAKTPNYRPVDQPPKPAVPAPNPSMTTTTKS